MKIPKNHTENEVVDIIDRVARRYADRFTFGYYDYDDIYQEAFILGIDGLERYDESRPLENFLSIHIRNRLITFVRDNYYRQDMMTEKGVAINEVKKMLIDTLDIENIDSDYEKNMQREFCFETLYLNEFMETIDAGLHASYREDYLKFLDGFKLTPARQNNLLEHIREILREKYGENFRW